jgi:Tfp pilus assembly protein PilO
MATFSKSRDMSKLGVKAEVKRITIGDLLIPMLGFIIFLLLTFFVYIPSISQAMEMQDALNDLTTDKESLTKLSTTLSEQDSSAYRTDFDSLNIILPQDLEVAEFASYVDQLAITKGLTLNELRASNTIAVAATSESVFDGKKVTGPVKYTGTYLNILGFLADLQSNSPYLTTIDNLQVMKVNTEASDSDIWALEMSISAIYNGTGEIIVPKYTQYQFMPYTGNADSLEILLSKAAKIKELQK